MSELVLITDREVLEGYSKEQLVDYLSSLGERITNLQSLFEDAQATLEGCWGTTLEEEIKEREK